MDLRRLLVIGLVLLFVAAPSAALACEAGCATSDKSTDAAENAEDCHRAAHDESGFGSRLVSSHDCSQHAAAGAVSLRTEPNRAAKSQHVALLGIRLVHSNFTSSREAISDHDLAPPDASSRLIAPLRI